MKKIYYKKLIRDLIPVRITESNGKYLCKKLNQIDFKKELIKKVSEESIGVTKATNKKELISELGDLLDVIDEIKKHFKISAKEISSSRKNEFKRKGGFAKKLYLIWAEDTGYKSNERRNK